MKKIIINFKEDKDFDAAVAAFQDDLLNNTHKEVRTSPAGNLIITLEPIDQDIFQEVPFDTSWE